MAANRLHRDVMRTLVGEIVSGERAAGDLLPGEFELADRFGVSRGIVRETLRAMGERQLITTTHGLGSIVNPMLRWDVFDPDVLSAMLAGRSSPAILAQYLECRRILEVAAIAQATACASEAALEPARAALAQMEETTTRPHGRAAERLFHEADVAFHQALIAATGNRPLGVLIGRIHTALLIARLPLARPRYRTERALPEHRRILRAVEARDVGEARAAMGDHLDTVARYLREYELGVDEGRAGSAVAAAEAR